MVGTIPRGSRVGLMVGCLQSCMRFTILAGFISNGINSINEKYMTGKYVIILLLKKGIMK